MGKIVEKKKKKGRPSLLDLQKRTLKEQQQQQKLQQQQKQNQNRNNSNSNLKNSEPYNSLNYKSATTTTTPPRRSTRRNPVPSSPETENDDEDELNGKRREKKLKLVLKLPSSQKSEADSGSLNSTGSDDKIAASHHRKRKINAIGDGSGFGVDEKEEKSGSGANPTNNEQDLGPSTPLPDKKLLLFILDRLQKKDTYGVFSEPVDPNELPDYHEVIKHPMDFGTIKKKLSSGLYANLEQFENDVFLICSNAMQYNSPDTIYFRQARSIQELAKKNFENLRQDSDDNEPEPEPAPETKVTRRGRPPTKNIKKPQGRHSLEHAGSEICLDATLATGGETTAWSNNDLRKGTHVSEKSSFIDSSGRSHGFRNDAYWLTDRKFERNDEGSMLKVNQMKYAKRQFSLDENRRNTYKQLSAGGREPSVLATFDAERKQLMAVGLFSEYGYGRSLARFAANIGTVAWKIASQKIEKSLPSGIKFGPGWAGENDIPPQRALLFSSPPQGLPLLSQPPSLPEDSCAAATSCPVEFKEKLSEKIEKNVTDNEVQTVHSISEGHLSNTLSPSASTSTSPAATSISESCTERTDAVDGLNLHGSFKMLSSNASMIRSRPPVQIHHNHAVHPGMNGVNGTYRFNLPAQVGKIAGTARPSGFSLESSQRIDRVSKTNTKFVHPASANSLDLENSKLSENINALNSSSAQHNASNEERKAPTSGVFPPPSWQGLSLQPKPESGLTQQKSGSVPPDLNVRFQSPGSPSSSRVDSAQPDLALQL